MQGEAKERWKILCEQVADERDPDRFMRLTEELLEELRKKEERLNPPPGSK